MLISMLPVQAWNNTDYDTEWYAPYIGLENGKYEKFGPRVDQILIKLYANAEAEWDALQAGQIDLTDWPLTKPYYELFNTPPNDQYVEKKNYGPEFGIRLLDINNNNDVTMEDGSANPVYPNPVGGSNDASAIALRQALWYCTNPEVWYPIVIGAGFYAPLYSTHGPSYGTFAIPAVNPYPYDPATAAALCEANGFPWIDDNTNTLMDPGERYWDKNLNGVREAGEDLVIRYAIRTDDTHRNQVGDMHANEIEDIGIEVDRVYGPSAVLTVIWFFNKEVHLYTAGWGLGVDPDHTVLWETRYHWHPGFCYNTGKVSDAILDDASVHITEANTFDEAVTYCHIFQYRFQELAVAIPFWAYSGTQAVRRRYSGGTAEVPATPDDGENLYRGRYWEGSIVQDTVLTAS
jgi:ABC-type transport system substrate-binding protein